ncbi:MAG: hypothetical protein IPH77_15795 [Ignavibacteria bacterium]|nr:hypothetical protein [Ignavibacteria bacterium]
MALSYTTSGVDKPVICVHDAFDVKSRILQLMVQVKEMPITDSGVAYRNAGGTDEW